MKHVLLLLALAAACSVQAQEKIRLGWMGALSGPLNLVGAEQKRGFDVALEHLGNRLGGLPIELVTGDGPDVVIQCVGSAAVAEQAIELATFGGRVVLLGSSSEPFRARAVEICWRELTLLGSRGFTVDDIAAVVDLYLAGAIVTDHLTARTRPLAEANEALDDLREGRVLRSVLVP